MYQLGPNCFDHYIMITMCLTTIATMISITRSPLPLSSLFPAFHQSTYYFNLTVWCNVMLSQTKTDTAKKQQEVYAVRLGSKLLS